MTKKKVGASARQPARPPPDCPADVEQLGRSSWTFLHTLAGTFPKKPTRGQVDDMAQFLKLFSKLYPCWSCAADFQDWISAEEQKGNGLLKACEGGRSRLGWWMCEAHNEVNRKLGKSEFDCRKWEERWRTGWKDGSCD